MDIAKNIPLSTGLLDNLEASIDSLEKNVLRVDERELREVLVHHIENIKSMFKILEDTSNPLDISDKVQLAGTDLFRSTITDLGIGGEVIKLREAGNSIKKIADRFKLSTPTVSRYLRHYDQLSKLQQTQLKATSVMQTTDRLEDVMNIILRQLHRLEGINDDVHVKYIGELRQTIESAARISEKIVSYQTYQQFMETVKGILITESPERAQEIIRKIKAIQNDPLQAALAPAKKPSRNTLI